MTITTKEQAEAKITKKLEGKEITTESLLNAGQELIREEVYREYPASDPKVVEALLLMYVNVCTDMIAEVLAGEEQDAVKTSTQLIKEMGRFATALSKTIKTLAG